VPSSEILTLRQAAARCGRSRKELQVLIERGALPALRRDDRWLINATDLALLFPAVSGDQGGRPVASAAPEATATSLSLSSAPEGIPPLGEPPADGMSAAQPGGEVALLRELLRQRDEQIMALQEERARLSGQIGFLQGLLVEREARLQLQERATLPRGAPIDLGAYGERAAQEHSNPAPTPQVRNTTSGSGAGVPRANAYKERPEPRLERTNSDLRLSNAGNEAPRAPTHLFSGDGTSTLPAAVRHGLQTLRNLAARRPRRRERGSS
jgi:hypothetical protein